MAAGVGGSASRQRSYSTPPEKGNTITVPVSGWARIAPYVIDPTPISTASGNLVINSGSLYQCVQGGTSAGSGGPATTSPSGTDGTVRWKWLGANPGTAVQTGSQVVAFVARGTQSTVPSGSAGIPPVDNQGASFVTISNTTYNGFADSFFGAFYRTTGSALSASSNYQTVSQFGGTSVGSGAGDEHTTMWVELTNVRLGAPHTSSQVERGSATNGIVTSAPITTTKPCLILSVWAGNGNVLTAGQSHTAVPLGGLTLVSGCVNLVSLSTSGYIQAAVAWRIATASLTPFTESWQTGTGNSEGAQLLTIAYEDISPVPVLGSGSVSDGADTASGAGSITNIGSGSVADGAESVSAAGSITLLGSGSVLDGAETLSGLGGIVPLLGSGSLTDGSESLSSIGSITLLGSGSMSDGSESIASSGSISLTGSGSIGLSGETAAGSGSISVLGSGSVGDGAESLSGAGVSTVFGSGTIGDSADSIAGVASILMVGSGSVSDGVDTASGSDSFAASPNGFGAVLGQSNAVGQADYNATQADLGYRLGSPFTASLTNKQWATGPTDPMVFNNFATAPMQPYAAAGSSNMGPEQTLARWLVQYGVFPSPIVVSWGISGSSLRRHWLAPYPTSGQPNYTTLVQYLNARQVEFNRRLEYIVWIQGETDAGNIDDANSYQANLTTLFTNLRADLSCPNLLVLVVQLNAATTFGPYQQKIRDAQAAYVASDPNSVLINVDDVPLLVDPHYGMSGQASIGTRCAVAIRDRLKPTANTSLGQGQSFPAYQQADPGSTAVSGGLSRPRSGEDPSSISKEFLVATSYPATGTLISLTPTGSAGFTQIGTQVNSTFGTSIRRSMAVFERTNSQSTPTGSVPGRPDTPVVQYLNSTSQLLVARVFGVSGSATGSTTTWVTASNNANSTALVFPSITSSVANSTAFMFFTNAAQNNRAVSVTNASMQNISIKWDSSYNPASGFVGLALATAQLPTSGAYGPTTVTLLSASVNVGFMALVEPPPPVTTLLGSGSAVDGDESASGSGLFVALSGSGSIADGDDSVAGAGSVSITGVGSNADSADSLAGSGSISLLGSGSTQDDPDSATGSSAPFLFGSGSVQDADDSLSGAAVVPLFGSGSVADGDESVSSAGIFTASLPIPDRSLPTGSPQNLGPGVRPRVNKVIRLEDIDRGVKSWFENVVDANVQTSQGSRRKVPFLFSSGERWVAAADRRGIRDRDGRLILPVIQVRRTGFGHSNNLSAFGADVPRLQISRLVSEKTSDLKNLDTLRPISARRIRDSAVYDVYSVPLPRHGTATYTIRIQAQYQTHINEILEKIGDRLDFISVPSFVIGLDGYNSRPSGIRTGAGSTEVAHGVRSPYDLRKPLSDYYVVGYMDGDFKDGGNLDEFTDQERILQAEFGFRVPASLMLDPEGTEPAVQVERTAFGIAIGDEEVHVVDDPSDADRIFGRQK